MISTAVAACRAARSVPSGRGVNTNPGTLLNELCHDLRQPAATIAAMAAAAEVECQLPEQTRLRLHQIANEARTIGELCRHVLGDRRRSSFALHQLVLDVVERCRVGSDATIAAEVDAVEIVGDETALRRALGNIIDNAVRAAGANGRVAVTLMASDSSIVLSVSDSGLGFGVGEPGIAGLGLGIAARVVHEHGGDLRIESTSSLGGANVAWILPAATATDAATLHTGVAR